MTISAFEEFDASDLLARNFGLYRDLSVALSDRIAQLKAADGGDVDGMDADKKDAAAKAAAREVLDAVKAQHRALQTVLELEASLVKRSRSRSDGSGLALDLDAARAEILARLALRDSER